MNYASFLAEIWPEEVRRVDLLRCRVIKWIVVPFNGNLPNLSNDPRKIYITLQIMFMSCSIYKWFRSTIEPLLKLEK